MSTLESGTSNVPSAHAPTSVHVIQPRYPVTSESHKQPSGFTTYPPSMTVVQCDTGRTNLAQPFLVYQNAAGVTGAQGQLTVLQPPAGGPGLQTSPGVTQYPLGTARVQTLPGDPENPAIAIPGLTPTSGQSPSNMAWNMSFASFPAFDPKKFINDEVRTLGAIQIIIGLMHIFSGIIPLLYSKLSVTGISGYLFWGGLSYIASGSLSVLAEKDPSPCVVNGSIAMNVVSAVFSLTGISIFIIDMSVQSEVSNAPVNIKAYVGSLLPFVLLEFFLTCVVSHFGCQAVCWRRFENMTIGSSIFSFNTANMTASHIHTTDIPVNAATSPANPITSPANPITSPANPTTSPANPTTGPAKPSCPDNVPPEPMYQDVPDYGRR
uniref:membrane-spanning 4-domains subfamily A member 18 n=1 Tax=Urocitellus parryii TaxID=9999 RepID=UPI000E561415|nr:membrane-spanning 4-domains subfamily A member 18 [Urocitellus parryii]